MLISSALFGGNIFPTIAAVTFVLGVMVTVALSRKENE